MSDKIINATDDSFKTDVLDSDIPVLVDFWAPWCGPCRALAPTIDAIADEYDGKVRIVKVNVDENNATAGSYGIRGIPSLLLFKNGTVIGTKVGSISKPQLTTLLDDNI